MLQPGWKNTKCFCLLPSLLTSSRRRAEPRVLELNVTEDKAELFPREQPALCLRCLHGPQPRRLVPRGSARCCGCLGGPGSCRKVGALQRGMLCSLAAVGGWLGAWNGSGCAAAPPPAEWEQESCWDSRGKMLCVHTGAAGAWGVQGLESHGGALGGAWLPKTEDLESFSTVGLKE